MLDEPSLGLAPLIVREIFHIIVELSGAASRFCWSSRMRAPRCRRLITPTCSKRARLRSKVRRASSRNDRRVVESYLGLGGRRPGAVRRLRLLSLLRMKFGYRQRS